VDGTKAGPGLAEPFAALVDQYQFPAGYRRMLLAAVDAFAEHGFHGTSTRDIAARAGMSPAALYAHFSSKEELLHTIMASALDLTVAMVSDEASRQASPAGRLQAVVTALSAWQAYHLPVARVVLYQLDALAPEHLAEVTGKMREIDRIVRAIVADGASVGDFTVTDISATATATLSLCLDVARWYYPGYRRTPQEIGEMNARTALRIVGVPEPAT
jgi:AcrR family transcriptional regulator